MNESELKKVVSEDCYELMACFLDAMYDETTTNYILNCLDKKRKFLISPDEDVFISTPNDILLGFKNDFTSFSINILGVLSCEGIREIKKIERYVEEIVKLKLS